MAWKLSEIVMIRCWVDGRSWYYEDHGASPEQAKKMAWDAWFALSEGQRKLELAAVTLSPADRPCYDVAGGRGGN